MGKGSLKHKGLLEERVKAVTGEKPAFAEEIDAKALKLARDARVIVAGHPNQELLDAAKNLKLHIIPFAGVQHAVDLLRKRARQSGITVANAHWNAYFTAQHAVALLLALCNRIIPHHARMVEGRWRLWKDECPTVPLTDKTVGLLGYGAINKCVHRMLSGFEVNFSALRRSWEGKDEAYPAPLERLVTAQLHSFLDKSDILVVALPLTRETEGMLGMNELKLLGSDGFLINVSRGKLIDEAALYQALNQHVIRGAGLDVWYDYHPEPDEEDRLYPYSSKHPFHRLSNVVLSPHRGASPIYHPSRWDEVIENIRRFFAGEELINVVDLQAGY